MEAPIPQVYYDEDCALCRMLADFGRKRAGAQLAFVGWQTYLAEVTKPPFEYSDSEELRVWDGAKLREGQQAWEFLIHTLPDLKAVDWLATKLGLSAPAAAVMQSLGRGLRRACFSCGDRPR